MRYLVYLLLLLGATAPASWSQYLVSDRRLLGMTIENPRAPGFGMEQVAPQVHKWYVPPHLAQSRAQPWYRIDSRYGADVYRRYVDHTLEGTEWYDTFGDPLGRGWLVYTWEQTQVQRNGSVLSKGPADPTRTNPYRQWFQNLVVASDQQEGRTYSLMVGDRIHTRFTPLTLYKPNFDGLRLDYASDRYVTTLLLSRPSSPAGGRRNNATHFMAGHLQAPLGDLGTVGLSYVNAHNVTTQTDFSYGNALRGSLTTAQNQPLEKIWVQLRDDSPEDGVAGATLFRHEIVLVDSTGRTLRGREIGLRPRVEGGRIRDGALVADGLDVVLLEYDLTTLDPTIVEAAAVEQVAVELAVANDYRIEMASNLQNNGDRLNPETVFFTRSRAAGNVQDESNGRLVIVEYGLPTANELLGIDWNLVEWKGLSLMGEGVLNRRYSKYPGPDEAHHHLVVEQAVAAYVNLGYNRGPWTLFGEAFSIADGYSTNYWLAQSNGEVRFKAPVPDLYEFVDDDDDYDAIPEWERPFQLSSRQVAWPGYDENRDFLNDHNQNANLLPDYEEPFLRYYSDRPEFLFGLDMNHNGTADRFENDQLPDYPYKRDHRGVNVYGRVQAGPETSLLIGRQQMGLVAGDGRTRSVYSMATWEANGPRLGKVRVFHFAALVQDDIPDDLLLWAQPVGGLGRMREVPDRRPGRDSWRSTLYADMDQRFGEGLRTMHRFKWETWRQRDDRQLVKEREGRMRSGFVGVVNKVEWTVPMGLGVLQPRFKSEYRTDRPFTTRLSTSSSIQETAILLWVQPLMAESVNVSYYPRYGRNLFNTQLQLGLEWTGFWMLDGTREDIDQDFRGRTILAQLTNRVAYSGYQLITRAGVQWIRRRFEDGARQQSSVLFMDRARGVEVMAVLTAGLCLALLLVVPLSAQVRTFILGNRDHVWRDGGDGVDPINILTFTTVDTTNTPDDAIEFDHRNGWITPLFFDGENIAARVLEKGGRISAPNLLSVSVNLLRTQLTGTVNGDHSVAFERKPTPFQPQVATFGLWVVLDFGQLVGIRGVRFYPRNTVVLDRNAPFHNDYLRGYEVWVNERLTNSTEGAPDELVMRETDNEEPIVEVAVPPQYVRLVKLRSLSERPFEIDEIEVYGDGYVPSGTYLSDLIDLEDPATIGQIGWRETTLGETAFSHLSVQARTGSDDSPILYRKRVMMSDPIEVSATAYWALDRLDRMPLVDDLDNWSTWRTVENGTLNPAPTPSRYIQFRLQFSGGQFETRQVDRLSFGYLIPPIADELRAEVFPRLAEAEKPATFRYAVLYRARGEAHGFDRLEVDTNVPATQIREVKVDGRPVAFSMDYLREDGFRLALPLITRDRAVLEFTFDLPIFRFGTTFSGRAVNSRVSRVPQRLTPGQVVRFDPADEDELSGLSVAIPKRQIGKLVGEIVVVGRILTPNGDGVNDRFILFFNLLQLVAPAPVRLEIFDVSGQRVHRVFEAEHGIGELVKAWDGRRRDGRLVAPGTYIWVLSVRADAFTESHRGVMAVAY